jgi:hypothetical protein
VGFFFYALFRGKRWRVAGIKSRGRVIRSPRNKNVSTRGFIYWARNLHQIATADTGSIQKIPDHFIVLKGGHHVKDFTPTGADMYWAKGS